MTPGKHGRPGKAAAAAATLGSWDRSAEPKPARSKRGRPSARTLAARLMAQRRAASQTPAERSAIAAAGGKAASHAQTIRKCPHGCGAERGARAMRKHLPECPARMKARIDARREKRNSARSQRQKPPARVV